MDELERDLLWLGVEDYTGLWQAVAEARAETEAYSLSEERRQARRAIDSLLSRGFIELFVCQEPLNNETVEIVPPERQSAVLDDAASWEDPEEGGKSVRFATTERGFAAYRKETGWTAE
jgi:hypothetical protein